MRLIFSLLLATACRSNFTKIENTPPEVTASDLDGDGFSEDDCDDSNEFINPAATEICDGIDNNCDGNIDEGTLSTFFFVPSMKP